MLSNKVSEIMTTQLTTASVTQPVFDVMEMMASADIGRVIITDDQVPAGIFTEKDVLTRVVNSAIDPKKTSVSAVMTSPIRAVREESHIVDAFGKMFKGKFRHLLVRGRRGKIVGIVSMRRILGLAVELGQGLSDTRTLGDIMSTGVTSVDVSNSIDQTVDLMTRKGLPAVIVATSGEPDGIFTERDVLKRVVTKQLDTKATPVRNVMTSPLIAMPSTTSVGAALAEMYRRDIRNMPVSNEAREIIGIVSMPDVLQYARAFDIDERVRKTWQEVAEYYDSEDQYTPG